MAAIKRCDESTLLATYFFGGLRVHLFDDASRNRTVLTDDDGEDLTIFLEFPTRKEVGDYLVGVGFTLE